MARAASLIGQKCKLFVQSGGSYGSPTWVEVSAVNDLTLNNESNSVDANDRGSFYDQVVKTGGKISATATIRVGGNNANLILDELHTVDVLDVLILTGTTTTNGAYGVRMDCQVHNGTQSQNRGDALYHQVTLMPCPGANPMKAALVTTGALTYAELTGEAPSYA